MQCKTKFSRENVARSWISSPPALEVLAANVLSLVVQPAEDLEEESMPTPFVRPGFSVFFHSTSAIRSATPTLWELAALGQVEQVARACLESSRSPKDASGKPWACPGVNDKTPGLGFTPLHACVAGLAAVVRGKDVSRPCNPPRPRGCTKRGRRLSMYARLARGYGRPGTRRVRDKGNSGPRQTCDTPRPDVIKDEEAYIGVCRTLLSAGADVQALDARCRTPLALAAAAGSAEVSLIIEGQPTETRIRSRTDSFPSPNHQHWAYCVGFCVAVLIRQLIGPQRHQYFSSPYPLGSNSLY